MITLQKIKLYYEVESGFDDLSIKSKTREIVDVRSCYYVSARKYTNKSLNEIGSLVNRCHATIINGINKFNFLFGSSSFYANEIYKRVDAKLQIIDIKKDDVFDLKKCNDVELLKQYFRLRHIEHTELSHRIINRLNIENKELRENIATMPKVLASAINELNPQDFNELIKRTELFLKVNRLIKKRKSNYPINND